MKEAICHIDSEVIFDEYIRGKFKHQTNFLDIEARNSLNSKIVLVFQLKKCWGLNKFFKQIQKNLQLCYNLNYKILLKLFNTL